ncbi:MAG TPA: hypothetical protein VK622_14710 [Puia sp.]|nr:hypothetical protein [Puia sp.]
MKNVLFTAQVLSLLGMLPIIALLYLNHASHDPKPDRPTRIEISQKTNPGIVHVAGNKFRY